MLMINFVFILRKSVNCSANNLFSNRNMNSTTVRDCDNGGIFLPSACL